MSIKKKGKLQIYTCIVGFIIAISGFTIHFLYPSEMKNASGNQDTYLENLTSYKGFLIEPEIIADEIYQYRIDILAIGFNNNSYKSNYTIKVLNYAQYEILKGGGDINDIISIQEIKAEHEPYMAQPTHRGTVLLNGSVPIYILIINNSEEPVNVNVNYYYSVIHPTYYFGLVIVLIGLLLIFIQLISYFQDWRRYLLLGTAVNLVAFMLRVATLSAYFSHPIFYFINVEMYTDYQFYYMPWGDIFKEGYWLYSEEMFAYNYGPLFMLTLVSFAFLPHAWGMGIPIFLASIGTGYLIYKITYKLTKNENRAIIAMIIYFLNPFTIFYSSFAWLNPSIFTFFVVLSFHFLLNDKFYLSLISLGISTMYKQFAVIFLPLILLYILKINSNIKSREKVNSTIKYMFSYALIIVLISLPFLIIDYETFIYRVLMSNSMFDPENLNRVFYILGAPVRFTDPFILLGGPNILTLALSYLIAYYIILGLCIALILIYFSRIKKSIYGDDWSNHLFKEALFLSILLIITVTLFYPRGAYKFYLVLLTPFISIFFDYKDLSLIDNHSIKKKHFKKRYLTPIILSWSIFFCYRYAYFLILIIWVYYLVHMKRKYNPLKTNS